MKKVISISMAAVMAASVAGCSGGQQATETAATTAAVTEAATTAAETTEAETTEAETEAVEGELSWDMAEEILTHISDPEFPDFEVSIEDFGAVADDGKLDTEAIQKAIDDTSEKGGGTVSVPSGAYDTGAITLKSNVNLCLENEDSVLNFTKDITPENYPLVFAHYEGSKCYNWSPFIYAYQQENIAVTGKGKLDGQADKDTWWNWRTSYNADGTTSNPSSADAKVLRKMTDDGVPAEERVFGEGHFLRPNFVQPIECENVLIEGVTIANSPMWELNPVLCTNFTARGVHIDTHGYNNDGCDPENCNYVLIEDCYFNTGDDCIAVKAGRNRDGRELGETGFPTQNLIIRNNVFADGHGGIACGSEMSGGIKNLFADNNTFDSSNLNYALRFKTNAERGGAIENVYLRNSKVKSVGNAVVHATMLYDVGRDGDYLPQFKNITIENLTSNGGEYGIFMEAFDEVPITGLVLKNVEITNAGTDVRALNWKNPILDNVSINGKTYPRPVETKILGVPVVGSKVEGSSVLLGGDNADLSYKWLMADAADGTFEEVGTGKSFEVPADAVGKFIKFTAVDKNGNEESSMAYKVLKENKAAGVDGDEEILRAAAKGYIDEAEALDLTKEVTNRDCAKMLAKLWNLEKPQEKMEIADIPESDPDYNAIAAVVEAGMMNLKDPNVEGATGTLYNAGVSNEQAAKRTSFLPDATIDRDEMGYIALLSCGVPYNETLGTNPKFDDAQEIDPEYEENVGASQYFGFVTAKEANNFKPKDKATMDDLVRIAIRISDFNNK
ncbi:MAG: glycoside hydrolase family 28 protein [Eubacteriales bacterium]|nr:glycoside hydrolase family 28 protein [Eubacteriales bacterium]